jgi:hypothetical protein
MVRDDCLLMVMVRDDWLFINGNGTNNHLSPLPLTNNQSSLTITFNKQTIFSHHYHQQTNNHLMVRDDCLFVNANGEI